MTDIASWYRPPEGADLVDGVTPDGMNVCREVAIRLFDCYAEECIADGGAFEDFQHTFAYSLAGGLVFRLFDEERGANNWRWSSSPTPAAVLSVPQSSLGCRALADAGVVGTCPGEFRRALERS